jgi:hypothetical protein
MGFSEEFIRNLPGLDPAFHLGEKPAAPPPAEGADEKHFMADVIKEAKRQGWRCYHTHNSRRSQAGFPDLVMIRGCFMIVAELKVGKNDLEPAQHDWMMDFEAVAYESNGRVRYFLWRPQDWQTIKELLK